MIKVTDLIARIFAGAGVKSCFGLQGGAVVHIFDSLEREGVSVYYMHHEQSASLASVANSKTTGELGCTIVTTGPAGTNAITGLLAAWQDSIPVVYLSGQVRSVHTSYGKKVRQVGTQEAPILEIVKPITKYTKLLDNPDDIFEEVNKAIHIAKSGRPGPVWLDIPLEVQWTMVREPEFNTPTQPESQDDKILNNQKFYDAIDLLESAEKPLLVLGYGVHLSKSKDLLKSIINKYNFKYVTTWTASDLFSTSDLRNLGIIGMSGQRGANKAVFMSDLLVCIGTHLGIPHTTTLTENYAPQAKKIIVNIDEDQLENLNINFDLKINADILSFVKFLDTEKLKINNYSFDGLKALNWYEPPSSQKINSNKYLHNLSVFNKVDTCYVVDGGGTALYSGFQSLQFKVGDRVICSSAISSMGTGLAETIGSYASHMYKKYVTIIGDGSFLMNIQDLQSIFQYQVPTIILVINNNGYLAIRNTQRDFLSGKYYGTHPDWGLVMPSIELIARGFKIDYLKVESYDEMNMTLPRLLEEITAPIIVELITDEFQDVLFSQGYKENNDGTFSPSPLSEMKPFL
jgi:acetolactate synthase-1/2/3 large subunit